MSETPAGPASLHRVVTVTGPDGRSRVLFEDAGVNHVTSAGYPGLVLSEVWSADGPPATQVSTDTSVHPPRIEPPTGGSVFRVISLPPDSADVDPDAGARDMGLQAAPDAEARARHASMHATASLDYLVVNSGEMWLLLDEEEVLLRPGSCVVQQATMHGFANRSAEPCVFTAVLVDAPAGRRPDR